MRIHQIQASTVAVTALACVLSACAAAPAQDDVLSKAQANYVSASNSPAIAQAAPEQLRSASVDLNRAQALHDKGASQADVDHYAYLASQRIAIAQQTADADAAQADVKQAGAQRSQIQLQASKDQTAQAQMQAQDANAQALQSKQQAQDANLQAQQSQAQAQQAQSNADASSAQAQQAQQQNVLLQQQLVALNAKQTERGMVLTLGSVLFDTNQATVKSGSVNTLDKLAQFMRDNPGKHLMIEGYTDNTGRADQNQDLSQRRAEAVRAILLTDGIGGQRILTKGYGEQFPVAGNDVSAGRQQNRRVEIVISDSDGNFPLSR